MYVVFDKAEPGIGIVGGLCLATVMFTSKKILTIKYGLESRGTQTREGLSWRRQGATVHYRPVLSSERAP
jgi:hypothetical protein